MKKIGLSMELNNSTRKDNEDEFVDDMVMKHNTQ